MVLCAQVVWTGGDKSTSLWCAYSGQFLGTIDRGREAGLPEAASFSRDSMSRPVVDDWKAKVDTSKASCCRLLLNMNHKSYKQGNKCYQFPLH